MEQRIVDAAQGRLRRSAYLSLREIVCVSRDGAVELQGNARSHYLKQVAQALVEEVDGVASIINRIEVKCEVRQ
jgi:osmotically-inducible protein OsmY